MPDTDSDTNAAGEGSKLEKRVAFWHGEIERAGKRQEKWEKRSREVIDRYEQEAEDDDVQDTIQLRTVTGGEGMNILYSNTETLRPALFSGAPRPILKRRITNSFTDPNADPARLVSSSIEGCIAYSIDAHDFDEMAEECITDNLLPGRMQARVNFRHMTETVSLERVEDDGAVKWLRGGREIEQPDVAEDGLSATTSITSMQDVWVSHVPWNDFRHSNARKWKKVWWVGFRDYLNKDEATSLFGSRIANRIKYDIQTIPEPGADKANSTLQRTAQEGWQEPKPVAEFWQIWNRRSRKVITVCMQLPDRFVREDDDPLNLKGFFPCPKPAMAIPRPSSLMPIPEFTMYQYQAYELDRLTARKTALIGALKASGGYDASLGDELQNIFTQDDLKLAPIQNFQEFAERGGVNGIQWIPVEQYSKAIDQLTRQQGSVIQAIYELTGISDILRGSTDPRETAKAQNLKAQFGSRRLSMRNRRIERFWRDLYRLMAEVIAEKFDVQQIELMSGVRLTPEAIQIMQNDPLRDFLVDVETGDTAAPDEQQDKRDVSELFTALANFFAQSQGIPPELQAGLVKYAIRKFRGGRDIEDIIDQVQQQIANQPPPENPDVIKQKAQAQERQQKMQIDAQVAQAEQARKNQEALAEQNRKNQEAIAEAQRLARESEHRMMLADRESKAAIRRKNAEAAKQLDLLDMREMVSSATKIDTTRERNARIQTAADKTPAAPTTQHLVVQNKPDDEVEQRLEDMAKSLEQQQQASEEALELQRVAAQQRAEALNLAKGLIDEIESNRTIN